MRSYKEKIEGVNKNRGSLSKNKRLETTFMSQSVTDLAASGKLAVPGSWSLFVPRTHLHLPPELSTSDIMVRYV